MLSLSIGFLLIATAAADVLPKTCLVQPPISLMAGSPLSFEIDNPFNVTCEATLTYSDDHFLPVIFIFEPIACSGAQLAQLIVPPESPDGDALVSFRCAGQPSETCNSATVTNGANRSDLITNVQNGPVGCVEPIWIPTTLLETATGGGHTEVHTVTTSTQSSTTSFSAGAGNVSPDATVARSGASSISSLPLGTTSVPLPEPGTVSNSATASNVTSSPPDTTRMPPLGPGPLLSSDTTSNDVPATSASSAHTSDFTDGVFETSGATPPTSSQTSLSLAVFTSTLTMLTTTTSFSCSLCETSPTPPGR